MERTNGLFYIATGKRNCWQAAFSAASFQRVMPEIPRAVCTSQPDYFTGKTVFDLIIPLEQPLFCGADKVLNMLRTPFAKTLFLDTDTYCLRSCADIFQLLDSFDLAAAHAPIRTSRRRPAFDTFPDPRLYPEFNTGVLAFNRTPRVVACLEDWRRLYDQTKPPDGGKHQDQPSFRLAVWQSGLRVAVLPPEFNLRTGMPFFIGGNSDAFILHDKTGFLPHNIKVLDDRSRIFRPAVYPGRGHWRRRLRSLLLRLTGRHQE